MSIVNAMNLLQNSQTEFEHKIETIINKEKQKIEQIYIWNPMTSGFM